MEKKKIKLKPIKKSRGKWYFLIIILFLYSLIYFISKDNFISIWAFFIKLILQIFPIFFLVYIFMVLINYFIDNKMLKKHLGL